MFTVEFLSILFTMLNEETHLESTVPQVEDIQKSNIENEVTENKDNDSEVTKENKQETEEEEAAKAEQAVTKPSRELKLLLELSKEANLDINIAYKRKSIDPNKHVEHQDHKYASIPLADVKRSMRSQNPEFVIKHQKFLSKLTSDGESLSVSDEEKNAKEKLQKKKEHFIIGGAIDEKTRKLLKPVMALIQNNKDGFCWRCHRESINISCETCPRSYHLKCLKHSHVNTEHWVCPECVVILNAENTKTRSPALKDMSLEQLCGLLKFALKRMARCNDSDPFLHPVNEVEFPDYKKYIVQSMDLSKMQRNIADNLYGSTNAFEADAKWLLHNSIIFNSYQSKLTTVAKSILKVCKQEMSEIENCPTCYLNANTKENWFVDVCPKPHVLLWAKLKGFPYWPAKAMSTNSQGMVDVRFFGAHDRAWVPFKECFLYSLRDPNSHKQMKSDIIACIKELDIHIENLKRAYGEFNYAPYRTPYDPENEVQQLQLLLPTYIPTYHTSPHRKFLKIHSLLKRKTSVDKPTPEKQFLKTTTDSESSGKTESESKEMEGYGTDEDMETDGDVETQSEGSYIIDAISGQGRVRMRGGFINTSGRIKTIPRQVSGGLTRFSSSDSQSPRRNSDQSTRSDDTSHLSNIPDKIITRDISESAEISFGNDEVNMNVSDNLEPLETKKISEQKNLLSTKLKMSDKLIKRLSETSSKEISIIEMNTRESKESRSDSRVEISSLGELEKDIIEPENRPSINDINHVILGSLDRVEILKVNPNSKSPVDINNDCIEENNDSESLKKSQGFSSEITSENAKRQVTVINKANEKKESSNSPNKVSSTISITETNEMVTDNENRVNDPQNSDDLLEEMYSEAVDFSEMSNSCKHQNRNSEDKLSENRSVNKRKRPEENENDEVHPLQNKFIKLVDINIIKKSQSEGTITVTQDNSILKNRLATTQPTNNIQKPVSESTGNALPTTIEIKSEPNSDAENENEDIEAKKQYLSALNISEKITKTNKQNEKETRMKTRTDTVIKAMEKLNEIKNKAVELMEVSGNKKELLPRLIKQLPPKQRARKTFPRSTTSSPKAVTNTLKATKLVNSIPPVRTAPFESQTNNNVVILTQPQPAVNSLAVLPPNQTIAYTANMGNPILTMVQPAAFSNFIVPTTTLNPVPPLNPISDRNTSSVGSPQSDSQLTSSVNGLLASANAIFTSSAQQTSSSTTSTITVTTTSVTAAPISSSASTSNINTITILNGQAALPTVAAGKQIPTDTNEDYGYLSGYIPESISKSISDLMHRAPPKLKPRPPGPLSHSYDSGLPSSAGRVTSVINSVAHKLTDYFRGMLIETLNELGTGDNSEALITSLRLENEKLKHRHAEELLEIKKNVNSILRDIQKSIIDERERVIEETKAACEVETIRRIEEAKSKQWCANCMKEAQFYCCWNTSYCDYPCQLKHWPKHMSKCTQNSNISQNDGSNMAKLVTPLILRKTTAPKPFPNNSLFPKSSKEGFNKASPNKGPTGTVKTSAVSAVTIVDTKPRSFEVRSSIPVSASLSGKVLNFNKVKPISMLTATSNTSSSVLTSPPQKFVITQSKQKTTMDID